MKRRAHQIVRDKRVSELPREASEMIAETAIGSKGWYSRGYLPHYDKPGTIQMLTFRLADAMPASLRHEWEDLLALEDECEQRTKLEAYLDQGRGDCVLRGGCAAVVENVLLRFNNQRYRLTSWVVMPNHVHALVELWDLPLGKLLKACKGASANAVNRILGTGGKLWQTEYWDRYMRDEAHFRKAQHYIEWNPVKAGLTTTPEQWPFSSANPKWRWSDGDRYERGRLLYDHASRSADISVREEDLKNIQPKADRDIGDLKADRNVGAPVGAPAPVQPREVS